jgi:hypothetical protein
MNTTPPKDQTLTPSEARFLVAFRTMDERGKRELLAVAESTAKRWPLHERPSLQLIAGSKK